MAEGQAFEILRIEDLKSSDESLNDFYCSLYSFNSDNGLKVITLTQSYNNKFFLKFGKYDLLSNLTK